MNADQVISQFNATGVQTCFHDRHINPQISAGLNGGNWSLKDYEARGGYQALRKILGQDGSAPNPDTGVAGLTLGGGFGKLGRKYVHIEMPEQAQIN